MENTQLDLFKQKTNSITPPAKAKFQQEIKETIKRGLKLKAGGELIRKKHNVYTASELKQMKTKISDWILVGTQRHKFKKNTYFPVYRINDLKQL